MKRVIMLMLLFVVLQVAKSQTITTLAPQSNCPSNIYFDYIANAKIQQQQLIVSGELVGTADSILQIVFTLENPSNTIKISSNDIISFFIEKVKITRADTTHWMFPRHSDACNPAVISFRGRNIFQLISSR